MTVPMRVVDVGGAQPYSIAIGPGLLDDVQALAAHVRGRHVLKSANHPVTLTVRGISRPRATQHRDVALAQ